MSKVFQLFPHITRVVDKEIGIEIECEGKNFYPMDDYGGKKTKIGMWTITTDNSLRGESCEYVLTNPIARESVNKCLKTLVDFHKKNQTVIDDSDRCGVHIHVNVQDMDVNQVINFVLLYLVFEDLLVKYCGEEREGNLFCLRARDAEYFTEALRKTRRNQDLYVMQNDVYRYASVNMSSLTKYGTLEFRSFRTPKDLFEIETWVKLLLCVKDASLKVNDPRDIVEAFSKNAELGYMREVFGQYANLLDYPNAGVLMLQGVRRIQDIAYCKVKAAPHVKAGLKANDYIHNLVIKALKSLALKGRANGTAIVDGMSIKIPVDKGTPVMVDRTAYDVDVNNLVVAYQIDARNAIDKAEVPRVRVVINADGNIEYQERNMDVPRWQGFALLPEFRPDPVPVIDQEEQW